MIVSPTRVTPSPVDDRRTRFAVTVTYTDGHAGPEELWFEFSESAGNLLVATGNPWLAAFLPLAARLGEPLRIADAVDPVLLDGAFEALRIWNSWESNSRVIPIEADSYSPGSESESRGVGAFFSGGVDSFYAVLDNDAHSQVRPPVNDLITVWGFDLPLTSVREIEIVQGQIREVAGELGKRHVEVWTNLRSTRLGELEWGHIMHGPALFAVGLCLEGRYRRLLVPSSYSVRHMHPWGSHAVVDPLFSTSRMQIKYAGGHVARMEKIGFIKDFPVVLKHLRCCWQSGQAINCSRCEKCQRTMAAFAGFDALESCTAFDARQFSLEGLRNTCVNDEHNILDFEVILESMPASVNPALREALEMCIRRNRDYYRRLKRFQQLEMTPWIGWLFGHIKRRFIRRR